MEDLLPKSITERAINNIKSGLSLKAAIIKAFEDEEAFVYSLLGGAELSKIGVCIAENMCITVYNAINNKPLKQTPQGSDTLKEDGKRIAQYNKRSL